MHAQIDSNGNVNGLDDQDWIHNVRKLVSPLDSTCRLLWLGSYVVRMEHVQKLFNTMKFDEHGLSSDDVHRRDRQNFKFAQCLCSRKVVSSMAKMREEVQYGPPERTEGTEMYLEIIGDYIDIFASRTLTLRDRIVLASKAMWFLKLWRLFILHGEHGNDTPNLAVNFPSQQCFIDIVLSCHFVVLLVKMFRDLYPSFPVPLCQTGSDVCEIFFSKVGGMAGVERAYDFGDLLRAAGTLNRQSEIEGDEDGVSFPRAHKKMLNVWESLHPIPEGMPVANLGDYSFLSTDVDIIEALKGFTLAQKCLRMLGMAPSTNCSRDRSRWFRTPWDFAEPLQKNLKNLAESMPEYGDNGEKNNLEDNARENDEDQDEIDAATNLATGVTTSATVGVVAGVEMVSAISTDAGLVDMDGPGFDLALQQVDLLEMPNSVIEVQHVLHEMQEEASQQSEERTVNEVLQKKHNPMVPLPGKDDEFIWKARLVSQLNCNPFLSKDRLQRVKGGGSLYYNAEELCRLREDESITNLCCGHDIAVLFEGERQELGSAARAVVCRRGDRAVGLHQRTSETAFVEIGRVQVIRQKVGKKFRLQNEILDMENQGSTCIEIYCYWYTCAGLRRFLKFEYDGLDKCWVPLGSVIQVVNLTFTPRQNLYMLDATESADLQEYVKHHNKS